MNKRKLLLVILLVGLLTRVGTLYFFWGEPLTIVDEQHYQAIAENIVNNHVFALNDEKPTAIRPPLYPGFLSLIYLATGGINLNIVRICQILLSIGIIILTYLLGRAICDHMTGIMAGAVLAVYPSFIFFPHLILTEILFTLFFLLFLYAFILFLRSNAPPSGIHNKGSVLSTLPEHQLVRKNRHPAPIFFAGLFLGFGSLTRSILYPLFSVLALYLIVCCRRQKTPMIKPALLFAIGFATVIGPWAARNHSLFNAFIPVGTMGGLNVYMGNYEHTPLTRAWTAVDLEGEKAWYYGHENVLSAMNEAQKQKWAIIQAKDFMYQNKMLTLKRFIIKTMNFWGVERSIIAAISHNHWPKLSQPFVFVPIAAFIGLGYALVMSTATVGMIFRFNMTSMPYILVAALVLYFTAMHGIVFGHSRYHLPLIPVLSVFSAWTLVNFRKILLNRKSFRFKISVISVAMLICVWVFEIVYTDYDRIAGLIT